MNSAAHPKVGRRGLAGAGDSSQLSARLRGWDAGRPQATGRRRGNRCGAAAAFSVAFRVGPPGDLRAGCAVGAGVADASDGAARGGVGATKSRPFGVTLAWLLFRQVLVTIAAFGLLHGVPVTVGRSVVVPQVHGSSVPPVGTLCRFQTPQPLPRGGGLAGVVHLPTGPTGGATFALPLALQLGDCDQVRLKRRQPRSGGGDSQTFCTCHLAPSPTGPSDTLTSAASTVTEATESSALARRVPLFSALFVASFARSRSLRASIRCLPLGPAACRGCGPWRSLHVPVGPSLSVFAGVAAESAVGAQGRKLAS
jgi:hypothetical protein